MAITLLGDGIGFGLLTISAMLECNRGGVVNESRTEVLESLKKELAFLEGGGYKHAPRSPWRVPYIFEDSPSCPNYSERARPHRCEDCWLMQFVAPELHDEQ